MSVTAIPPTHMTPSERLDEVASILAAGITRLMARNAARSQADTSAKETVFASTCPPAGASMVSKLDVE
ncbi:MAG: hypothetical protein HQL34_05330, partial [Alphaproteobacteria bacterium]|nr:hypothetical protein [Alphaproteobacteria bacterium]